MDELGIAMRSIKSITGPVVDVHIDTIFNVIFGLTRGRPSSSEESDCVAVDSAPRGLQSAGAALEEGGTRHDIRP